LEAGVLPIIREFLSERGFELSEEKTVIPHIEDGFDWPLRNTQPLRSICIWCVRGMIWSDSRFTSVVIQMRWHISEKSRRF